MRSTDSRSTLTTDQPLLLTGSSATSAFRHSALLQQVQDTAPELAIAAFREASIYLLDCDGELSSRDFDKTASLLGTDKRFVSGAGVIIAPRKGTISPWSSKASDIFHNCGLSAVRRVERGTHLQFTTTAGRILDVSELTPILPMFYDRMTQGVYDQVDDFFVRFEPSSYDSVDILGGGLAALEQANQTIGLALSDDEMAYLLQCYQSIKRNPTDVELVMFAQVNSEHCRHKIFNAAWTLDGVPMAQSLFDMIRHTHATHPEGTLVAYKDNSGVIEGFAGEWFESSGDREHTYTFAEEQVDIVMKVETHNHPTAISPFPGAATGVGGEIRDEGATGIGARSKAGLSAFMVSHLRIPGFEQPWETDRGVHPSRLASPLDIMMAGPIGGAAFGNEFGRPQLCGIFRTFEELFAGVVRGYHKPIMAAGGMGNIKRMHVAKAPVTGEALIVQLGGPAMRIGLGGGAASSMATGSNEEALDFDSVQRDNAEMQRRCQEAINACVAMGADNPILSIHDIGAGGLSNGCPELVSEVGGVFFLRAIHNEDSSMSPMEIWCCEAQERYVLAISQDALGIFEELCRRERCPMAVIGRTSGDKRLCLIDEQFDNKPIDIDMDVILGKPPALTITAERREPERVSLALESVSLGESVQRVLRFPTVANKTFLITITDRTVTGLVARDQLVGPYQVPIADVAVTANGYRTVHGEAMSMGERTSVALLSGPASGRLAVGEALTNMAAAAIGDLGKIKCSGNWMSACGESGEDAALYETVRAVGLELCPSLGISIPVGKDSLSMRSVWQDADGAEHRVVSPLSLVISAFAPDEDIRKTVTPDLKPGASALLLIDLGAGQNRLGGSVLGQVWNQIGDVCPDLDDPKLFNQFFAAIQGLVTEGDLLAYHDRSDGGLLATVVEMALGGRRGCDLDLDPLGDAVLPVLFAEELGAVLQVAEGRLASVQAFLSAAGLASICHLLGRVTDAPAVRMRHRGELVVDESLATLGKTWSAVTAHLQARRDNADVVASEFERWSDSDDPGLSMMVTYDPDDAPTILSSRPAVAILREQGVNGHVEMAAAFTIAGFRCTDVHMTDLLRGTRSLNEFIGLVACGGFSYGDVLGAGSGWAKSVLFNNSLKDQFASFFARPDTFALGVCNGCQMMSQLKAIIPGADHWPEFRRNACEQFEARFVTVEVLDSPSILLTDMVGSRLCVPIAHGEGRTDFTVTGSRAELDARKLSALRYVDNRGVPTERYPLNPNGSADGLTGMTTPDGRVTIMMPHPERAFRSVQLSYRPPELFTGEAGPWLRMFQNARQWVG